MQYFINTLLICSATMSALALFYMAITPLLAKRYSVMGRYYAWLVIVIGLIVPFRPHFDNAIINVGVPSKTMMPIIQIGNEIPVTTASVENVTLPTALPSISWWQVMAVIWLAGMIVFLAYHVIKHYRFIKMARRWSENITDKQILTLLQSLKTEMGISKQIEIQLCASVGCPMMIGFANPRLLLPSVDLTKDELCFILKHELVHFKRKDLWYKCLMLVVTAIHWFNPIVYLMAKAIDLLCELSCDNEIVRSTDADTRQKYSETIIGVVKYQSKLKTALSTNFYGGKKSMKNRISSIMDTKKKKAGLAIIFAALIMTVSAGIIFAASASDNTPSLSINNMEDGTIIRIADNENLPEDYSTYVSNVNSRPDLEFYIEGEDIAQIEISCETEYLYAVDWTETQHEKYWNTEYYQTFDEELQVSTFYPERLYEKTMTLTFDEGFSDYEDIWYRWTAWDMHTWATEDNYSHFLGVNSEVTDDMTEEEKLALAAGNDGSGRTGVGHIQLDGYPEELTEDCITITITDRNGNSTTKIINVKVSNDKLNQTVVTASLEN